MTDGIEGLTADQLRARFNWKKVVAPTTWRPRYNGDELIGYYGGKSVRNGSFGQYEVAIVHVPSRGSFFVSGVRAVQLVDAAILQIGSPIRFVFLGVVALSEERKMKTFELFIPEGPVVSGAALPNLGARQ